MEPLHEDFCFLCLQKHIPSELIFFSCNHTFCFQCSPYLILSCLKSPNQILNTFLQTTKNQCCCPLCSSGRAIIPSERLQTTLITPADKRLCEGCDDKPAVGFCIDCNKVFCDDCLGEAHRLKKYQTHKIADLDQSTDTNPKHQCVCPGRHYISHICKTCQITICSYCLKVGHEKHEVQKIEGFNLNSKESLKDKLKLLNETCSNIAKIEHSSNQKFSQIIDEIIDELQGLKKKNETKNVTIFQSQYNLVQSVMELVQRETNQKNLHPNKQYHISKMLQCIRLPSEKKILSEGGEEGKIINLINIKQMIQNLNEGNLVGSLESANKQRMPQNLKEENFTASEINDFKSNPIDLLQNEGKENIIAEKSFQCTELKSNFSCTFTLNGENFLVWTGFLVNEEKIFSLIIYNLSQMKLETNLSNETSNIAFSFVSIYPKTNEREAFKKKYCMRVMLREF